MSSPPQFGMKNTCDVANEIHMRDCISSQSAPSSASTIGSTRTDDNPEQRVVDAFPADLQGAETMLVHHPRVRSDAAGGDGTIVHQQCGRQPHADHARQRQHRCRGPGIEQCAQRASVEHNGDNQRAAHQRGRRNRIVALRPRQEAPAATAHVVQREPMGLSCPVAGRTATGSRGPTGRRWPCRSPFPGSHRRSGWYHV